jgi:hypothetical protein
MAIRRSALPTDLKQLLDLLQKGKLFAVQDWLKAGKRLRASAGPGSGPLALEAAVTTGFHSLVEELLRAGGWSPDELTGALKLARSRKHFDIAELLLEHGAQSKQVDFQTCCERLDLPMMERHLRAGTDPNRHNDFAQALSFIKARPLLGFYRQFRTEFPALEDQAALALSQAVQNNQIRWTALLAWAGADPFRPVPTDLDGAFPVAPENCTTAANEAVWRNHPEILKLLRLKPTPAQALTLLGAAVSSANADFFRTLLSAIPPNLINDTPRGSCAALERMVSRGSRCDRYTGTPNDQAGAENLRRVELLLDAGARWNPPPADLRRTRRDLLQHDGRYLVQLLRLLLYTPNAANLQNLLELCHSQTLLAKLAVADPPLASELHTLRKAARSVSAAGSSANTETAPPAAEALPPP